MGQVQTSTLPQETIDSYKKRKLDVFGSMERRKYTEDETREFSESQRSQKEQIRKFSTALYHNPLGGGEERTDSRY